uniref:Uncharacterized protein n=1 Tax=Lotus japonicus TaxID=34305 RepID=I3S3V5_LOTJA|nr:unknown [Lotus japonicus]
MESGNLLLMNVVKSKQTMCVIQKRVDGFMHFQSFSPRKQYLNLQKRMTLIKQALLQAHSLLLMYHQVLKFYCHH